MSMQFVHKSRNSSVELYRIIATFAVLIVHFNGWFVGGMPNQFDVHNISAFRTGQMIIQAMTCICVNMFIVISGYFGIKLKLYSLISLCLKLLFFFVPTYVLYALFNNDFRIGDLFFQFRVITRAGWFIQCYLMLMFLSPLLNSFTEKYGREILPWCIVLLCVEFWFGCIMSEQVGKDNSFAINRGYSVIHFVLIYMLGRCVYLFQAEMKEFKRSSWICAWIVCTILICFLHIWGIKFVWNYSNPVVVISSICSFVPFLYGEYYNRTINFIAKSTLAVYVIHSDTPVVRILMKMDNQLLEDYSYFHYLLFVSSIIFVVFIACIIYDKLCGIIINPFLKQISPALYGKFEYK